MWAKWHIILYNTYVIMQFNSMCFYLNISEAGGQLWAPPEILFLGQRSGHELRVVNVAGSILHGRWLEVIGAEISIMKLGM
jgi:hypothetical protein